jgi:hypothetical protein
MHGQRVAFAARLVALVERAAEERDFPQEGFKSVLF